MKKLLVVFFALVAVLGATAQTKFPLRVNCNLSDADLYINDKLYTKTTPNLVIQLPPATYSIKVARQGYLEYKANVTVPAGGTTLSVTLQPIGGATAPAVIPAPSLLATIPLNVLSNVAGAEVYLSGRLVGNTPLSTMVVAATYDIVVKAPGYLDFSQRLQVRSATQVNATLTPQIMQFGLSVNANVAGADVFINGNPAGKTPFNAQVPFGSYTILVRAAGYADFSQNVLVNGPVQVNAILQPLMAGWQLSLPDAAVNKDLKGGHWSQIQIYIDGALQKGSTGQVMPGRRLVRIVSGALQAETLIDFQAGRSYAIEPAFGVMVK